jgi:hypothetical protein
MSVSCFGYASPCVHLPDNVFLLVRGDLLTFLHCFFTTLLRTCSNACFSRS